MLISENVASLERRRLAGTLLEGQCTALEEAWYAGQLLAREEGLTGPETLSMAKLVGYEHFFRIVLPRAPHRFSQLPCTTQQSPARSHSSSFDTFCKL